MKKSKENVELAVMEIMDPDKPIVKPFFDRDAELIKFIQMMLPAVPNSIMKVNRVYQSAGGRVLRFRVNFFIEKWKDGSICPTVNMAVSKYIQINVNLDDNKFEFVDITI
jgi:hypothetical protein